MCNIYYQHMKSLTASAKPESVSIDLFLLQALAAASSLPLLIHQVGVGHFVFHLFQAVSWLWPSLASFL